MRFVPKRTTMLFISLSMVVCTLLLLSGFKFGLKFSIQRNDSGCFSWDASNEIFEKNVKDKDLFSQERIQSLQTMEETQNRLLAENENLKRSIQEQTRKLKMNEAFLKTSNQYHINGSLPLIYGITPTYKRLTQKADLTRLSQTFLNVPNFHWIVVEDSESKTNLVTRFLRRCRLKYTHLAIKTRPLLAPGEKAPRWLKARGVHQRNLALNWLRHNIDAKRTRGVVYFMDDDNTYDLEIFKQIRNTKKVSVWPVGLAGGLTWEGPVCENGKVVKFRVDWGSKRSFPIDMAGFAFNLKLLFDNPLALIDSNARPGNLESSFLELLVTRDELEPLADECKKVLVWHTKTAEPNIKRKRLLPSSVENQYAPSLEV